MKPVVQTEVGVSEAAKGDGGNEAIPYRRCRPAAWRARRRAFPQGEEKRARVIFRFEGKLTLAPYFLASTHQQKTWGSERFRLQIEALAQRDLQVRPRGRPRAAEKCT